MFNRKVFRSLKILHVAIKPTVEGPQIIFDIVTELPNKVKGFVRKSVDKYVEVKKREEKSV